MVVEQMQDYQDVHGRSFYMFMTSSRWLGFRLDFLSFLFVTTTAFAAMGIRKTIDAGLLGYSLEYALRLTGSFQWCVRQSAEVEQQMTSVERALEYTKLEAEPRSAPQPLEKTIPASWPSEGCVIFRVCVDL
jgi:ATP-binding cassette subfamily C (CFTR/MRP) protein 4